MVSIDYYIYTRPMLLVGTLDFSTPSTWPIDTNNFYFRPINNSYTLKK